MKNIFKKDIIDELRSDEGFETIYNKGSRVIGQRHEFKNHKGTVIEQLSEVFILVSFDDFPMVVCTTVDNLVELKDNKILM